MLQPDVLRIGSWQEDDQWGRAYPEGARVKRCLISPAKPDWEGIKSSWAYLFKQSDKRYPDQFWGEVIAYQIGLMLGISVPPAHVAVDEREGQCAALIEWFYKKESTVFIAAGNIFHKLMPDFDREKGRHHNIEDALNLIEAVIPSEERIGIFDAIFFDTLIGNTDRHQDNWGFLVDPKLLKPKNVQFHFAPWFDNGTSLGCERRPDIVCDWSQEKLASYVRKGCHHFRSQRNVDERIPHLTLYEDMIKKYPSFRERSRYLLLQCDVDKVGELFMRLSKFDLPIVLSEGRIGWIMRLLCFRLEKMKEILS